MRLKSNRKQQIKSKLRLGVSKEAEKTNQNKIVLKLNYQLINLFTVKFTFPLKT